MCGRFTLAIPSVTDLAEILGASFDPALEAFYGPRFNIAPTSTHVVLRMHEGHRELVPARWGLVNRWAKDASAASRQINARAETARERPAYREAFERRRCVIPADGFYEWAGPKGARRPIWYHPPKGGLLHLAGLYESWKNPATGDKERTFTVLTTPANDLIAPVHDRMPALLDAADLDVWLATSDRGEPETGDQAMALLRPAPRSALEPRWVSRKVNAVGYDAPDLIAEDREAAEDQPPEAKATKGRKKKDERPAEPEDDMPLFSRVKRA
jgi:putative SOS response-associated peptidase YedK